MENASKALIIAAAILVAILLISLTIFVFNSPKEATQEVTGASNELKEGAQQGVNSINNLLSGITVF